MRRRVVVAALAGALALALGCAAARSAQRNVGTPPGLGLAPIVQTTRYSMPQPALEKIAIAPLAPSLDLERGGGTAAADAPALVGRFLAEALAGQGIAVIPASDFEGVLAAGAEEPAAMAGRAAARFGATGVILGRVERFREREGRPLAVTQPASVSFEVTLYAAPDGRRLWTARFAHTQQSADTGPLQAARYPGGGARWLTAEELARWGAANVAKELVAQR